MPRLFQSAALVFAAFCLISGAARAADGTLTVFSAFEKDSVQPLLDGFTKQTGIKTELVYAKPDQLNAWLESEGAKTPADVLLTVDAAMLNDAAQKKLLKPISSVTLDNNIPADLRDREGRWYGLGKRVRVIVYSREKVRPEMLSSYEALAQPQWKGKVLIRSAGHPYNLSLMAAMVAENGAERTEAWAKGIAGNLARPPEGGDGDQIKAVAAGKGEVAITNSHYYARFAASEDPEERNAAAKTALFYPNQSSAHGELHGAQVNVSGAGVVAASDMAAAAVRFIEYLSSREIQPLYGAMENEYPVLPGAAVPAPLASLPAYRADDMPPNALGPYQAEASKIATRSGWK